MIIKQLTLHNFGVYAGTNTFVFRGEKPVVLIGGLNGRGKTTFLDAVLLALYGSNSFAYKESNYKSYGQYLRSFVNENDTSFTTYIELEFILNAQEPELYLVHREWDALTKRTHEKVNVKRNQKEDKFLASNWSLFMENMLPSALSNFFFFDGEKIAELAVDSTSEGLRESIRSMLGLTVLDQLRKDVNRTIRKIGKYTVSPKEESELEKLRLRKEKHELTLTQAKKKNDELLRQKEELRQALETAHNEYILQGGDIVEQQQELFQKRALINAKKEQNRENLINIAAMELPFALVKDLLVNVNMQGIIERNHSTDLKALDRFEDVFTKYVKAHGSDDELISFYHFFHLQLENSNTERIYSLSDRNLNLVDELINRKIQEVIDLSRKQLEEKKALQKSSDEIDSYLAVDINENEIRKVYKKIKSLEQKGIDLDIKLESNRQKISSLEWEVQKASSEYSKFAESILSKLEGKDDSQRVMKYSSIALNILEEYTIRLQSEKTRVLALTITDCYHKLANKQNLIEKIVMNPKTLDIVYLNKDEKEVSKDSLSAGEKQLMVIAILWALAICSKKKLPVIIDTPLSRLDSEHRTAMITTYFPNASDQTIILSTDAEIDSTYYEMMKESVGDEFTLNYDDESRSTSIARGYFSGDNK